MEATAADGSEAQLAFSVPVSLEVYDASTYVLVIIFIIHF